MLTPDTLKDVFLNGMVPADQYGRPMSAAAQQSAIQGAAAAMQRKLGIALTRRVVTCGHVDDFIPPADLEVEKHDAFTHDPNDFLGERYVWLQLPTGPIKDYSDVLKVQLRLPGMGKAVTWPDTWIQTNMEGRYIQIFPMGSSITTPTFGLTGLTMTTLNASRSIPNAWRIAYLAGYTEDDLNGKDHDLFRAWGALASIGVLIPGSIDRYLAMGVNGLSASVDGLSNSTSFMQSAGALKYAALSNALKEEFTAWELAFKQRTRGLVVGFV